MQSVRQRRGWLVAVALLAPALLSTQARPASRIAADSAEYRTLVARIAAGDTAADFTRLRELYATLPAPDEEPLVSPESLFAHARRATDARAARGAIDSVLADNFGNSRAHEIAERIYRARGDSSNAAREAALIRQFVTSIMSGRDGLTIETAFLVYGVPEEYTVLRAKGVKMETQALLGCGKAMCDELTGKEEKTGKTVSFYFRLPDRR